MKVVLKYRFKEPIGIIEIDDKFVEQMKKTYNIDVFHEISLVMNEKKELVLVFSGLVSKIDLTVKMNGETEN